MDLAFEAINTKGKFQKIISLIVIIVGATNIFLSVAYPFLTKNPDFLCRIPGEYNSDYFPCVDENLCKPEFEYKIDSKTTLDNWSKVYGLYCEKHFYVPLYSSIFFIGGILACLVLSTIPDRYGRKAVYQILLTISFVIHLNCLFTFSPVHLVFINFLAGFNSYAYSMSTLIVTEYIDRGISGLIMSVNNSMIDVTGIMCSIFFMYINNMKVLFAVSSFISLIAAVLVNFYMVESPRWLNSRHRIEESITELKKIAQINGTEDKLDQFLKTHGLMGHHSSEKQEESKTRNESIFSIFMYKSQRNKLLLHSYIWFAIGFTFFGLLINMAHLEGNFFTVSIVAFTAEFFSELFSGWFAGEYGRIRGLKYANYIGGIAFFLYAVIPLSIVPILVKNFLLFLVSLGFSSAFNIIYIYSPEAFPTSVRSTVMGFLFLVSRIGAMLVPPLSALVSKPPVVFAVFSVLAGYATGFLEETLGKPIEDEIPEVNRAPSILDDDKKLLRQSRVLSITSEVYFAQSDTESKK